MHAGTRGAGRRVAGVGALLPGEYAVRSARGALLVAGALLLACGAPKLPPSAPGPALGRPLPEFTRRSLDGAPVSGAALRGKVVVVEFFAQYCKPCWTALPQVQRLAAGDPELAVLGVGEDEFASDTRVMAQQLGLTFPVVHDGGNALAGSFRVRQIPATLVLDRQGVVRWMARPGDGVAELRRAVAAVRRGE